ncbi:putative P-loop containing nucleoside triphosphate hydrolase protein [Lyophyllum shimeji]|uniref:P-loop containing nucleoside triphosphate hydrolase protein n=1 Tax=Lyophyllum shimeji TaxID=47721 RepID=A0A9P3PKE1_LYOSH|nr:putative P-loop containing nucleoside triphosphate hydrolase protein [Lyophyllum shimeji]
MRFRNTSSIIAFKNATRRCFDLGMADNDAASQNIRVILVGVGGATCSGKTTLAKHLKRILPDSVIIHQDDFAPPQELVPVHPIYNVQDWDAAPGAIVWPKLVNFLREIKKTGKIPPEHRSHDHLNVQKEVKLGDAVRDHWVEVFDRIRKEREAQGKEKIIWGLLDGFLLYWNQEVVDQLDVCIFLRVPEDVLRKRRHERHGYHTAEGALWRDPPGYWEQIVYPAYVDAHRDMFTDGDVEAGMPGDKVEGLMVLEPLQMDMGEEVSRVCRVLEETARK